MKPCMFVLLFTLVASAAQAAKLHRDYLPPPGASQAGGGPGLLPPFTRPSSGFAAGPSSGFAPSAPSGATPSLDGAVEGNPTDGVLANNVPVNAVGTGPDTTSFSGPSAAAGVGEQRPVVAIIKMVNQNPGDGTFTYSYEAENGIEFSEQGELKDDGAEGLNSVRGMYAYTGPDGVRYKVAYTADENGFRPVGDHLPTPPPVPAAIQALIDNAQPEQPEQPQDGGEAPVDASQGTAPQDAADPSAPQDNDVTPSAQDGPQDDKYYATEAPRRPTYRPQARPQGRPQPQGFAQNGYQQGSGQGSAPGYSPSAPQGTAPTFSPQGNDPSTNLIPGDAQVSAPGAPQGSAPTYTPQGLAFPTFQRPALPARTPSQRPSFTSQGQSSTFPSQGQAPSFNAQGPEMTPTFTPAGAQMSAVSFTDGRPQGSPPAFTTQRPAPIFTSQGSAPSFTSQGSTSTFAPQGSAPTFTSQGSTSTFAPQGSAPTFTSQGSTSTFAPQGSAPTFTSQGSTPSFTPQETTPSFLPIGVQKPYPTRVPGNGYQTPTSNGYQGAQAPNRDDTQAPATSSIAPSTLPDPEDEATPTPAAPAAPVSSPEFGSRLPPAQSFSPNSGYYY